MTLNKTPSLEEKYQKFYHIYPNNFDSCSECGCKTLWKHYYTDYHAFGQDSYTYTFCTNCCPRSDDPNSNYQLYVTYLDALERAKLQNLIDKFVNKLRHNKRISKTLLKQIFGKTPEAVLVSSFTRYKPFHRTVLLWYDEVVLKIHDMSPFVIFADASKDCYYELSVQGLKEWRS